jgi:anti-sigma factor RsiW
MQVGRWDRLERQERAMSIDEGLEAACVTSAPLNSIAVIAAADGEANEATLAHLRECPACAARVMQLRKVQSRLRRWLYRLHCPSSDLLVDYCQGLIDPFQRAALAHHIALCPHCSAEVALLERGAPTADIVGYGPRVGLQLP